MDQKYDSFFSVSSNPSSSPSDNSFDQDSNIRNPTLLFYVTLLPIVLFVFCVIHLFVNFLLRSRTRVDDAYDEESAITLFFKPYDLGVDQSFIDALPVFRYETTIGLHHDVPFDCVVCICEFEPEDEIRLLPNCSHAFHVECIDRWILSNPTCPLCRDNLLFGLTSSPA